MEPNGHIFNKEYPKQKLCLLTTDDDYYYYLGRRIKVREGINEFPNDKEFNRFYIVLGKPSTEYKDIKFSIVWDVKIPDNAIVRIGYDDKIRTNMVILSNRRNKWTRKYSLRAIKRDFIMVNVIPEEFKTKEFYKKALMLNCKIYPYIPEDCIPEGLDQGFYNKLMRNCPEHFSKVPDEFVNDQLIDIMLGKAFHHIRYIPERFKTDERYEKGIERSIENLKYAPRRLVTSELAWNFFKYHHYDIRRMPEWMLTEEIYQKYCESVNYDIKRIPNRYKTYEICLVQLTNDREKALLSYVPKELRDDKMCEVAVKTSMSNFVHVPYKRRTKEMCKRVVMIDGYFLKNVPPEHLDVELCVIAVRSSPKAFAFVPKKLQKQVREIIMGD